MLGHDRPLGARHLRAPEDRPEVLRIHDRVERDQQRRIGREELLECPFLSRLQLRGHALVHSRRDHIQPLGRDDLDPGQARQLVEPRVVAEPRRLVHLEHAPGPRGLEHRIASMDERSHVRGCAARRQASYRTRRHRTPSFESSSAIPLERSSSRI